MLELKKEANLETVEAINLFHEIGIDQFTPSEEDIRKIKLLKEME